MNEKNKKKIYEKINFFNNRVETNNLNPNLVKNIQDVIVIKIPVLRVYIGPNFDHKIIQKEIL